MLRVLPPTFKPVLQQMSLLQVAWILTSNWVKLSGSRAIQVNYVTYCKTSLRWAGKTRDIYWFRCNKIELLSTFCNPFPQPVTNWFVARQVWFVGNQTRNVAIRLALEQSNRTSCRFFCLFYRSFSRFTNKKNVSLPCCSLYMRYWPSARSRWLDIIRTLDSVHLACSGSQSERWILFILPARGFSHIIRYNWAELAWRYHWQTVTLELTQRVNEFNMLV